MLKEFEEEEESEVETGGYEISLVGIQLGDVIAGEEHIAKLARARFQGTPQILFTPEGPSSQPALTPLR
jgi:hypothetical protein